jgi:16S rRNA (uracil1498-N3)-methyltransferase
MADRFYAPDLSADAPEFLLTGPEAHHLATVCRAKVGSVVTLFDGKGMSATGRVKEVAKRQVLVGIESIARSPAPVDRTWGVAFPKGDRALVLVEKCVELGVARIVPLLTERTVTQPGDGKRGRFERAAMEACKQCGRDHLLRIDPPRRLSELLAEGTGWLLDPSGETIALDGMVFPSRVAIGPEGGWSDAERLDAESQGWKRVTMARWTLRVETAAIALAGVAAWHDTARQS